jgi:hypothetical protein
MHTTETPKERGHLENICVDGRMTVKWILKKRLEIVDWINLTEDRDQ